MHQRCPACGLEFEPDASFCIRCGVLLDRKTSVEYTAEPLYRKRKETDVRKLVVAAVLVLLITSSSVMFLTYSGSVSFDIEENETEVRITNSSSGSMHGFIWNVRDEMNFMISYTSEGEGGLILTKGEGSLEPGIYRITLTAYNFAGTEKTEVKKHTIHGERVQEAKWNYNGEPYTLEYTIKASSMTQYLSGGSKGNIERWPGNSVDAALVSRYTDAKDILPIEDITEKLKGLMYAKGITEDAERTNFIMAFVQSLISYESDMDTKGSPEFWKYPLETLFSRAGDCEDVAMLTMTLLKGVFKLYGIDKSVALVLYWGDDVIGGHAMAAIELSTEPAPPNELEFWRTVTDTSLYEVDGKTYYVCETTGEFWKVGWISTKYSMAPDHLIVI